MKQLKILIITMDYSPPYGGLGTVTLNLEKGLMKAGHTVKLLNFDSRSNNNSKYLHIRDFFYTPATKNPYFKMSHIMNPLKTFNADRGFRDFVFNNMIYRISKYFIQNFQPDIIHLTRSKLYATVYGTDIPFVANCHSEEIEKAYSIKYVAENAAKIICISNFSKQKFLKFFPDTNEHISVIYPSINVNKYKSNLINQRKNQIVVMGRLEKYKNISTIIKAYDLLSNAIQKTYKMMVIGEGNDRSKLESLVNKLQLKKSIIFLGVLLEKEKINVLKQSKLYILCPTQIGNIEEAFGITYLEAQATGIPVIASKIGGIPEAVGNGGIYVDDINDPHEIAVKITKMLTDSKLYSKIKNNILTRINNFDTKRWIINNLNIYKSVLSSI